MAKDVLDKYWNGSAWEELHPVTKAKNVKIDDTGGHFSSNNVEGAMAELFQSVSSGKKQLETAITDKDGTVSKSGSVATFKELENGIDSIPQAKGNASRSNVLAGKTFSSEVAGIEVSGTMTNHGALSPSLGINGTYTIPQGYHNGSGKVTQSIPTKGAQTYTPTTSNQTIPSGRYLTGTQTIKGDANLKAENILQGKSIFGVAGSLVKGMKYASGVRDVPRNPGDFITFNGASYLMDSVEVTGLTFKPRFIMILVKRNWIMAVTNYMGDPTMPYEMVTTGQSNGGQGSAGVYQVNDGSSDAYVNSTGFRLPLQSYYDEPKYWYAWE